ncbi:phosphoribosylamine--glycine ligase [Candidatus Woesearchaeota archaeon]|nr:phosphoribosylamine--glycine ligase [Candidatus Woesearchaeota archaeon]
MTPILLIGNGAREHAIAEAFKKNENAKLYSFMKARNPGIEKLSEKIQIGSYSDIDAIKLFALNVKADFAFIGPEEPLANGVADALEGIGVPCVGPKQKLAQLETSKSFTRNLLEKYHISGNPKFKIFNNKNKNEIKKFLDTLPAVVVKPDGLTGGKGVKVQGDHFQAKDEALKYCEEALLTHNSVVVEEKMDGVEFSLQCLTDGKTVVLTPPAQDHKRAYEDDKGPNTGGMGSYSAENHLLPFLKKEHVNEALKITKQVAQALYLELKQHYKGVMYGGFIITKDGVKLVEYNARFGDPEAMNILPIMKTDFVAVCEAIIDQKLDSIEVEFENKATVLKYAVPKGYPDAPVKDRIAVMEIPKEARLYYASVDERADGLYMTGSRAIGLLGIGNTIAEAEKIAEKATEAVKGNVFHRKDIGTEELIGKRVRKALSFK